MIFYNDFIPGNRIFKSLSKKPFLQPKSKTLDLLVSLYFFINFGRSLSHLPSYLNPP